MTSPSEIEDRREVLPLAQTLERWNAEGGNESQLARWLQGYDLPPAGHEDEPYVLLLTAIDHTRQPPIVARRLAKTLATLFFDVERVVVQVRRPSQLLFNGLFLAAGLADPDILCDPLQFLLERGMALGDWRGVSVNSVLLPALATNQLDARLEGVWDSLLRANESEVSVADMVDAYDGTVRMPENAETRGRPWIAKIRWALARLIVRLESSPDRMSYLRSAITHTMKIYVGGASWHTELLHMADHSSWPRWAVRCLPGLYFDLGVEQGKRVFLVSSDALNAVPEDTTYERIADLCSGEVAKVAGGERFASILRLAGPLFDIERITNPFASGSASLAGVNTVMVYLQDLARQRGGDLRLEKELAERRKRMLFQRVLIPA